MKTYRVTTTSSVIEVEADTVRFEPGHVTFWGTGRHPGSSSRLVLALHNPAVEKIREIRE